MPDPKTQAPVAPAPEATEQDAATTDPIDQAVDEIAQGEGEAGTEDNSSGDESSGQDQAVDEAEAEAAAAKAKEKDAEKVDDTEEFMSAEDRKKDNVQRRIDKLTAELKDLRSENAKLRETPQKSNKPQYTDEQLKGALKKALEEGDHDLAWEVMQYKVEKAKEDLISQYESEKTQDVQRKQAVFQEWNKVCDDYSKSWQDDAGKEIYPGAKNELSLANNSTLLYRLAQKFYNETVDADGNPVYRITPGGQRLAVADAITAILKRRRLGGVDTEKKKLERMAAKAKKKGAIPSTSSSEGDAGPTRSSGNPLSEYVAERRKFLNERRG